MTGSGVADSPVAAGCVLQGAARLKMYGLAYIAASSPLQGSTFSADGQVRRWVFVRAVLALGAAGFKWYRDGFTVCAASSANEAGRTKLSAIELQGSDR